MKHIITFITLTLLTTALASCGGKSKQDDSWFSFGNKEKDESTFKSLEIKFEDLKAQITGGKTHSEKAVERAEFWQAAAAVLIVVAGFALVFGAALGSQARRVRKQQTPPTGPISTATE